MYVENNIDYISTQIHFISRRNNIFEKYWQFGLFYYRIIINYIIKSK